MSFALTEQELRILGALLEKQVTTPDQYPLTLKALTSACNQKSNREPVMQMAESEVRETVALMEKQYLVSKRTEYGSRVSKHRQRFCNTEFGPLKFDPGEFAVVCLLMLRGPQTPGELRSRSGRLHEFGSVDEVNDALKTLAERDDGPFVVRLNREPGRREARYAHLFGVDEPQAATDEAPAPTTARRVSAAAGDLVARVEALEKTVEFLKKELGISEDGDKP